MRRGGGAFVYADGHVLGGRYSAKGLRNIEGARLVDASEERSMPVYMMKVTDFREFSVVVGELNIEDGDISDPHVASWSKNFAKELREDQPEMFNKGLCLTISDAGGTIRLIAPMDIVH
jgi:hypothetical protein